MNNSKEYFIWCDESVKKGKYYSNFYGGVLIESKDLEYVLQVLRQIVKELNIKEEIKWGKVDAYKLPAFKKLMDVFFDPIEQGKIKVRVMFKQNAKVPKNLNQRQTDNEYFMLYYQFIKHAFGLKYIQNEKPVHIRAHFDYLPDTKSKVQQFKEFIKGLESSKSFIDAKIKIRKSDIVEVDSKDHLPLQFLDVVLGAIQFKLNNLHKIKIVDTNKRGKKTIAKEKLYKHINSRIRNIRPYFNIGISTGIDHKADRWLHPYAHWSFIPKDFEIDKDQYK